MKQLIGIGVVAVAAGALIGLSRIPHSDPEAVTLIRLAANAPKDEDYTAQATTFANLGNRILQTDAVVYNAKGGRSRIEYRLGGLAGVISGRNGNMHWHYDPLNRSLITKIKDSHDADPNVDPKLNQLLQNCRATVKNHTTVAGRPATEVTLCSKDSKGASRTLWIDPDKGVILRYEERNSDNDLVMATVYRSIEYGKTASPDKFLPIVATAGPIHWMPEDDFATEAKLPAIHKALRVPLAEPHYIPAGFAPEGHYLYRCPGTDIEMAVTRYVDGLNSLTIIQSQRDCGDLAQWPQDLGMGKSVYAKRGNSNFWVLGELPEADLQRVRDSLGH